MLNTPQQTALIDIIIDAWGWTDLSPVRVLQISAFGNLMVLDKAGHYWRICPEELAGTVVASSEVEYEVLLANPDFQEDWALRSLMEQCSDQHGPLPAEHAYLFVTPPPLGGSYGADNVRVAPLAEVIGVSGSIARQIKDLPDGSKVKLTTTSAPPETEA